MKESEYHKYSPCLFSGVLVFFFFVLFTVAYMSPGSAVGVSKVINMIISCLNQRFPLVDYRNILKWFTDQFMEARYVGEFSFIGNHCINKLDFIGNMLYFFDLSLYYRFFFGKNINARKKNAENHWCKKTYKQIYGFLYLHDTNS